MKIEVIGIFIIFIILIFLININLISPQNYYNDYSDVLLVCNNASSNSQEICSYFISKRLPKEFNTTHIVNLTGISTAETVTCSVYTSIKDQINSTLQTIGPSTINYIVTTKGVPLRACSRSVDSMLAYGFGDNRDYFYSEDIFSHDKYGGYLVTRLDGASVQDAKNLIDNSNLASMSGYFLINKYSTGYPYDYSCTSAYNVLTADGKNAELNNSLFVTNRNNLSSYWSWGSNSGSNANSSAWNLSFNPGAIGETAVSTSARTLANAWSGSGQSLISDLIRMNITGVKGYVYEPYLNAIAKPDILFKRYTSGYNLADSFYMASAKRNWMDVIIGDPKTFIVIDSLRPSITLNSPIDGERINNGTILNFSIYSTRFIGISEIWYNYNGTNMTLESPYTVDTSDWSYGNYSVIVYTNDTIGNIGIGNYSFIINTSTGTAPVYNKFDGNTTNIKALEDKTDVSNLVLEQSTMGKIKFLENNLNVSGLDLDNNIIFANNGVTLNSTEIPNINVSANITIYNNLGVHYGSPVILRDGNVCNSTTSPPCYNFTPLNAETVVFNVTGWSTYQVSGNYISQCSVLDQADTYYVQTANIVPTGNINSCINITASNIVFDCNGYSIANTSFGKSAIYASDVTNITVKNCNVSLSNSVSENAFGVYFDSVNDSFIVNNTFNYTNIGIYLDSANNNQIINNSASINSGDWFGGWGIYLVLSSNNNLTGNTANLNSYHGIYLISSSNNQIINNTANSNGYIDGEFISGSGIYFDTSSNNNQIINNTANSNGEGINIYYSSNNTLTGNNMSNNGDDFSVDGNLNFHFDNIIDTTNLAGGYKIYYNYSTNDYDFGNLPNATTVMCANCNNVTYRNINISHDTDKGLYLFNTTNSIIYNITASLNNYGIYLQTCSNNNISNNTFNLNGYGIYFLSSSNNTITGNTLNSNAYSGIDLSYSSNNSISKNTLNSNKYGLGIYSSSNNNNFTNNNIWNCTDIDYGCIYLSSASNNLISGVVNKSVSYLIHLNTNSNNNTFRDMNLLGATKNDTYLVSNSINNTFLNVSYNSSKEYVVSGSQLIKKWYYQAYVNDTFGNSVSNANITAFPFYNTRGGVEFSGLMTNSSGWTNITTITDYVNNAGTRSYYSFYAITVINSSYPNLTATYNSSVGNNINYITLNVSINSNITMVNITNQSGTVDGTITRYQNFTINATVTGTEVNVWADIWGGVTGISSVIWRGILNFVSGNLWSATVSTNQLFPVGFINYTVYVKDNASNLIYSDSNFTILEQFNVSQCRIIEQANSVYIQGVNIVPTGNITSCINITASNITYDCNGKWISNTSLSKPGIYAGTADGLINITVRNCNVTMKKSSGGYGIQFNSVNNSLIINNTANSNYYGIYLSSSSNNNLTGNTANSNDYGIYFYLSSNNNLTGNTVNSNVDGIGLSSSSNNNTLINNTANSNDYGISLYSSSNNNITGNTANSNDYGIYLYSSSNNQIINNTANSNTNGIYLDAPELSSGYNNLTNNNIWNCTGNCISVIGSSDNIFSLGIVNFSANNLIYLDQAFQFVFPMYYIQSNNNIFKDIILLGATKNDTFLTSTSINNTFINVSYNSSKEYVSAGSQLTRKWHLDILVNDSYNNNAFNSSNVTLLNVSGSLQFSELTNSSGRIGRKELVEYINNGGTSGVNRTYSSNYTINASYDGYITNSSSFNLTTNRVIQISIADLTPPNITQIIAINESGTSGGAVTRGNNITINATITGITNSTGNVWVKIWTGVVGSPGIVIQKFLDWISGNLWSTTILTNSSYPAEIFNFTVYSNDSSGNEINSSSNFTSSVLVSIYNCSAIGTANTIYMLRNNVTHNGTCININANNITINFSDYSLTGNSSGYGIYINDVNNSIIDVNYDNIVSYLYRIFMQFTSNNYNTVISPSSLINISLNGTGNTTLAFNLPNLDSFAYRIKYDGVLCSENPNCTVNLNSNGIVNVSLGLD